MLPDLRPTQSVRLVELPRCIKGGLEPLTFECEVLISDSTCSLSPVVCECVTGTVYRTEANTRLIEWSSCLDVIHVYLSVSPLFMYHPYERPGCLLLTQSSIRQWLANKTLNKILQLSRRDEGGLQLLSFWCKILSSDSGDSYWRNMTAH